MPHHRPWRRKNTPAFQLSDRVPLPPSYSDGRSWGPEGTEGIERDLEFYRQAFKAGNRGVLVDALLLCERCDVRRPKWLSTANLEATYAWLEGPQSQEWRNRYEKDQIDRERTYTVEQLRDQGIAWEEVFDKAQDKLAGTEAAGSASAIKRSYERFIKNSAEDPYRYVVYTARRRPPKK